MLKNIIFKRILSISIIISMIFILCYCKKSNSSTEEINDFLYQNNKKSDNPFDKTPNEIPFDKKNMDFDPNENENMNFPPQNSNSKPENYNSVYTFNKDEITSDLNIVSNKDDESAILIKDNASVDISMFSINRVSDNSTGGDTASFYGVGSSVLVTNGKLYLTDGTITTDSKGGAGIFSYDKGEAHIKNVVISTNKDTSGGIHVAGGGKLSAINVSATTNGESSAAIRSDRGGGTMNVKGGKFITNGNGSPAVYCTANITVEDSELIANNSEGICVEGLNTTTLKNINLTSNMPDLNQNDNTWSVIVYQSMSGDSQIGKGTFNMENGSLTSNNGGLFYTTNTESEFNLTNVNLIPSEDFEYLLQVTGNTNQRGWGKLGDNGANCTFNATNQKMDGSIITDDISSLNLNLYKNTIYKGNLVKTDKYYNGNNKKGFVNITIDETSTWIITKNSYVDKLTLKGSLKDENDKSIKIVDSNGHSLVDGDSNIILTVKELINK